MKSFIPWVGGKSLSSDYLEQVENRLERVFIENNLIKVYDRPKALFYCDPPYHKTEYFYDFVFTETDHERLRAIIT